MIEHIVVMLSKLISLLKPIKYLLDRVYENEESRVEYDIAYKDLVNKLDSFPGLAERSIKKRQAKLIAKGQMGGGFERYKTDIANSVKRCETIKSELSELKGRPSIKLIHVNKMLDEMSELIANLEK